MTPEPRKIALYWHNGRSLGHTSSSAKVADYLLRSARAHSIAGITGAYRGHELLPGDVDLIKIPAFTNRDDADGWNLRPRLAITEDTLHKVRTDLITTFLDAYRPDVLLSSHIPRGADDELVTALEQRSAIHSVLTLRGILFDRVKTWRKYFSPGRGPWICDHYCQFNIHTHPEVFRLEDYYDIPAAFTERMHYTGYLAEPHPLTRDQARARLGVAPGERLVVAAMGGGQGAGDLWQALSTALAGHRHHFDRALLVPGPYLEPTDLDALRRFWAGQDKNGPDVTIASYQEELPTWMRAADLVLGAAGSNMLGEILATGANALVIPRQLREIEQQVHSDRLQQRGLLRQVPLTAALSGALTGALHEAFTDPLRPDASHLLWPGGSYDRNLPGEGGTRCAHMRTTVPMPAAAEDAAPPVPGSWA
ncbi:glycosyltransferase [Streptomyces sp. NPDC001553]|uniref:glycosyltransferase family protein n=1 Tax=Streptomyces sp. NPDC001553 TaxID=3154385 RepID=UPI00332AA208